MEVPGISPIQVLYNLERSNDALSNFYGSGSILKSYASTYYTILNVVLMSYQNYMEVPLSPIQVLYNLERSNDALSNFYGSGSILKSYASTYYTILNVVLMSYQNYMEVPLSPIQVLYNLERSTDVLSKFYGSTLKSYTSTIQL